MDAISATVPPDFKERLVRLVVAAVLVALGLVFLWVGRTAIHSRHLEQHWEQTGSVQLGPLDADIGQASGVDTFDGADAVRIGAGVTLSGGLFGFWGVLMFWSGIRPGRWEIPRRAAVCLCVISLVLLVGALMCILPPWRIGTGIGPAMWSTMVGGGAFACVFRKTWVKYLFPGLILLALVVGFSGGRWWLGIILAVFAAMAFAVHGLMLWVWNQRAASRPSQ